MCLSIVKETYDNPSGLIMDAWKEFGGTARKPTFQQFTIAKSADVPLDKWITATDEHTPGKKITALDSKPYAPGFHVFYNEQELKEMGGLRRVFVRKITCLGIQTSKQVVVAQEMFVPSDPNGWPPKKDEQTFLDKAKRMMKASDNAI
jgi:hypothetical protein